MAFGKANKSPNATKLANELNGLCKKLKTAMDKKKNLNTNKFVVMYDKSCILRSQLEGMAMTLLDAKDSKQFDYVAEISHRSSKILSNFEKLTNRPTFQTNVSSLTNITNTNVASTDAFNAFPTTNSNSFANTSTMVNVGGVSNVPGSTNLNKTPDLFKDHFVSDPVASFENDAEDNLSDAQGWANFDDADNLASSQTKSKVNKNKFDSSFDELDDKIVYKKDYLDSNMDTALDHFNTSVDYNLSFDSTDNLDEDNKKNKESDDEFETEVKYKESHKGYKSTKESHKDRDHDKSNRRKGRDKDRGDRDQPDTRDRDRDKEYNRGNRDQPDNREYEGREYRNREYRETKGGYKEHKNELVDVKKDESDKNDYIKLLERCLLQTKHKGLVYQLNNEEMSSDYRNKVNIVNSYLTNNYDELEDDVKYKTNKNKDEYMRQYEDREEYRGNYRDEFDSRGDLGYRGFVDRKFEMNRDREYNRGNRDQPDNREYESREYRNREYRETKGGYKEHGEPGYHREYRQEDRDKHRELRKLDEGLVKSDFGELKGADGKNEMYNEFKNLSDTTVSEKHKGGELNLYGTNTTLSTTGMGRYGSKTDLLNYELSNNDLYGKEIEPLWRCENDGGLSSYLGNYIINNNVSSSVTVSGDFRGSNVEDGSKKLVVSNTNNVNRLISLSKYKLELNINELNRENYVLNLQLLLYTYINISNIYIYLIYNDTNTVTSNVNNLDNYNRLYNTSASGDNGEGNVLLLNNSDNLNNNINKNNNININIKLDILNLVEFPILYIKLIENDGNINKLKLLLPIGLYLTLIPLKYNISNFNKLWNSMEMNVNKMTRLYLSKVPLDINNLLNLLWKYFSVYVNNNLLLLSSCGNEILLGSIYIKNKTLIVIQLRSISNNLIISTMNVLKEIFSVLNNKYDCSMYNFKLKNVNVLPLKFQTTMVNTSYPMLTNQTTNALTNKYY